MYRTIDENKIEWLMTFETEEDGHVPLNPLAFEFPQNLYVYGPNELKATVDGLLPKAWESLSTCVRVTFERISDEEASAEFERGLSEIMAKRNALTEPKP